MLRQYFPKGTDLAVNNQAKLNTVARELNERPRKTLTAAEHDPDGVLRAAATPRLMQAYAVGR